MGKKIIIGVHGLGNKPSRRLLKKWWKNAIREGLKRIDQPRRFFKFELAYWAHYFYEKPQKPGVEDSDDPRYIRNPYVQAEPSADPKQKPGWWKMRSLNLLERLLDSVFLADRPVLNLDFISDFIIRTKFKDLDIYYNKVADGDGDTSVKEQVRDELARLLRKHRHRDILLIAHSMGSIVAYEVLTQHVPDVRIHTFVTLGSPLGLPVIMKKILDEQTRGGKTSRIASTPENIERAWYNFADLDDRVAVNYTLADDFVPNSRGVGPRDIQVHNDYQYRDQRNPHKSYGYLRASEVAEVIHTFLSEEKEGWLKRLGRRIRAFVGAAENAEEPETVSAEAA